MKDKTNPKTYLETGSWARPKNRIRKNGPVALAVAALALAASGSKSSRRMSRSLGGRAAAAISTNIGALLSRPRLGG